MKLEWKKTEKDIYLPGKSPVLVTVPKMISSRQRAGEIAL